MGTVWLNKHRGTQSVIIRIRSSILTLSVKPVQVFHPAESRPLLAIHRASNFCLHAAY